MLIRPLISHSSGFPSLAYEPKLLEDGYNRSDSRASQMHATNDHAAILEFLNCYSGKTLKSFSREVERFVTWLWLQRKISLSAVKQMDIKLYLGFLLNPEPVDVWCGARKKRYLKDGEINAEWKMFTAKKNNKYGLSVTSAQVSEKVVVALFNHLVSGGYLNASPMISHKRKKKTFSKSSELETFLHKEQVEFIVWALQREHGRMQDDAKAQFRSARAILIIKILFFSGLRISELASHSMGNISGRKGDYKLSVIGKGGKPRNVTLSRQFMKSLSEYRRLAGYDTDYPTILENDRPLIAAESRKKNEVIQILKPISDNRIHNILKECFSLAADKWLAEAELETGELKAQMIAESTTIRSASAHWLRHTRATYLIHSGATTAEAMEQLGHADPGTLAIYSHVLDSRRCHLANKIVLEEL